MSTTVTYKGQTLTTVENQTKTLQTAGTWVEGDFTLTDVTQGGGGATWTKTVTITEPVTSGSNNAEALLKSIEPELNNTGANGQSTIYIFNFEGNTITNKGAIYASWAVIGTQHIFEAKRAPNRWGSVMDFYVSAGTVVTVTRYDPYTYEG
jgi:hypothetical protein